MNCSFSPSIRALAFTLFLLSFHSLVYADKYKDIYIEPTPKWVEYRGITLNENTPVDEINNGVFYQLLDTQIRVTDSERVEKYSHYIETLSNQAGVDYSSQLNIDFDPSYQKLVLNTLFIIRNGETIDRLKTARMSLLNRETELENQIYNGSITLNILIDDLQVGDSISYSYTRYGDNPVYQGIFAYTRSLNWSVPIENQYVRVLWGKEKPLKVETRHITPNLTQKKLGKFTEYQVHMNNEPTLRMANETPNWYEPYGWISFSESKSWFEVVEWAETLYQSSPLNPSVLEIAENIKQQYKTLPEQITAALQFTQKHIRYVGLEMGINSHMPTPAHETIALKYGDCKDKALLFIALLKALGVDAYPALVNTGESKLLKERLPAVNLFDHVIVSLTLGGKQLWLDPTLSHQEGALDTLFQPDYGYALIVKAGESALTSMTHDEHNSHTFIRDSYVIPVDVSAPATFNVESQYLGNKAQTKYSQIERDGRKKLTDDYEVFYQRIYPQLSKTQPVDISTDKATGILMLSEAYSIKQFWEKEKADYERNFYPSDIRDSVFKPQQITRNDPLWFEFPNNITHEIKVKFIETGWGFENSEFIEDNAFFYFKRNVNFEDNTLTLVFDYRSKVDHIPSAQISEYLSAREVLLQKAYYGIRKYSEETKLKNAEAETDDSTYSQSQWMIILAAIFLIGMLFVVISWRIESKRRPVFSDNHFFPISVTKFLALSIATYGMYTSYWAYRNWKEIKQQQQSHIMPIARGFFSIFWFYPLFTALKDDSEKRFNRNQVMVPILAVIFAILLISFSFLSSIKETYVTSLLALLSPLLYIPILNYINSTNKNENASYSYNSQWNLRSIVAIALFMPLFSFQVLQQTPLIPSSNIISETSIMKYDMKYLYRQNVLPTDETIQYFYSEALFSLRDDGNGFTNKRVFSYWQDDTNGFQSEIAIFQDVKHITAKYADSESDNTIVTITRDDGSQFELFISSYDDEDKEFVQKLKALWRSSKV